MSIVNNMKLLAFLLQYSVYFSAWSFAENISLELVHVLYRHGDRTPIDPYPTDPYKNSTYWPLGWGQLTNEGKRRHYRLGQYLRTRYSDFIEPKYNASEILVRSTDVDRTLMSAESNLAGLYIPLAEQVWNSNLTWQPVPVHTVPVTEDYILTLSAECPRYEELFANLGNIPEVKKFNADHQDLYKYLAENSGKKISKPDDVEYLYDTLFIERRFNLSLPGWTNSVYPDALKEVSDFSFSLKAYTKEMQKLRGGPLVREIRDHFKSKIKGELSPSNRKMFMYSAHDISLTIFLSALNIFNGIQPPYASLVMVELHKDSADQRYVKILYKNHTNENREVSTLTLPGCSPLCPIDDFLRLTEDVVVDDIRAACVAGPRPSPLFPALSQIEMIAVLAAGILGLLLAISLIGLLITCGRLKRYNRQHQGYQTVPVEAE